MIKALLLIQLKSFVGMIVMVLGCALIHVEEGNAAVWFEPSTLHACQETIETAPLFFLTLFAAWIAKALAHRFAARAR